MALLSATIALTGCPKDDPIGKGDVYFVLGPVVNGECSILDKDANTVVLAGPAQTRPNGNAKFNGIPEGTEWVLIECSGGQYLDESTGELKDAIPLRTFANISTSKKFSVAVTPLTELATRTVEA